MRADLDPANSECLSCHAREMPGLYKQWASSLHAKVGVGCVDCHAPHSTQTLMLEGEILELCAGCHQSVSAQFGHSGMGTITLSPGSISACITSMMPCMPELVTVRHSSPISMPCKRVM